MIRKPVVAVCAVLAGLATLAAVPSLEAPAVAGPTSTTLARPRTTPARPGTTTPNQPATTRPAPTTTTTIAGRPMNRIAPPVSDLKVRATSLPLRRLGTITAVAVGALALVGFAYGKIRSRIPTPDVAPQQPGAEPPPPPVVADPTPPPPSDDDFAP